MESKTDLENKINFLNLINKIDRDNFFKLIILIKLVKKHFSELKIAIKTPNPSYDRHWGDFFFATSLKKSLEKKGFEVIIHEFDNWDADDNIDIVIVLRGLRKYITKPQHLNLMWNISHPNDIPLKEYEEFDIVFVASNYYANVLIDKVDTFVHPLLQCTDINNFHPQKNNEYNEDILFVGNTRNVFRKIIQDILKTNHDFSIYGHDWDKFIDEKFIKGSYIENNNLNKLYSNCKILLNDHWGDMIENDFVSNRIFDALACKTFVISDNVESIPSLFNGSIVTYADYNDLDEKLRYYLTNEKERLYLANKGYEIVIKNHTFDNRVNEIISIIVNKFFPKFIMQFETNTDYNIEQNGLNNFEFIKNLLNIDFNRVLDENKSMTIEIAKLHEKIFLLENEKKIYKEHYINSRNKGLFNILKDAF